MPVEQFEYAVTDSLSVREIQGAANKAWELLKAGNPELRAAAAEAEICVDSLPDRLDDVLRISKSAAGFDPSSVDLIIAIVSSQAAAKVGKDLWSYVILPWLRREYGDHAVTEKRDHKK